MSIKKIKKLGGVNDDRYEVIKEIAENISRKKVLKAKGVKAGAALKRKQKHEMTEKDIDNLSAYADFNADYDSSFDGTNDANEITEEVSIMDAYEEGKDE
jgi:hypothetical protein